YGHWSGSHSVAWDINAPPYGDLTVGDQFQKHNYPFGILINAKGERYVDEGANFHSHTYAKYGGEIIQLPGMFAWQVLDAKVSHLLRSEYRIRGVTKAEANTLEDGRQARRRGSRGFPSHRAGIQRRLPRRHSVQSQCPGWPQDPRPRHQQDQLGQSA